MADTALVTGGGGFVGQWLIRTLLHRGFTVHAVGVHDPLPLGVLSTDEMGAVRWRRADLTDADGVAEAIDAARPDRLYHLAGISFVPEAQSAPINAYDVNVLGLVRILHAIRLRVRAGTLNPRVLVVGSGEQYGRHDTWEMPLAESAPQRPLTVYAASKAAQELVALQAYHSDRLHVVMTRSFNHSGIGHASHFLLPSLVTRAIALRQNPGGALTLGNQSVVRDFLHVQDVVDAYCALLERSEPGETYNVSSGVGTSVRELAQRVLQRAGVAADIVEDPALVRPVDVPVLIGSPNKLRLVTGWQPRCGIDDIIDDLIRFQHAAPH